MRNRVVVHVAHVIACIGSLQFAALLHGCADAQLAASVPTIADVRDVDLGSLDLVRDDPKHTFTICNTTDHPITIMAVNKSCGCQTADVKVGTVVPPGEVIRATYTLPAHRSGKLTGSLIITTDATDKTFQEIILTLRADIRPRLWASPPQLQFVAVRESESVEKELRIESADPGLIGTFQEASTSRKLVSVALERKTPDALVFRVTLAPDVPIGESFDLISLRFDNPQHPMLIVRVRARKGHRVAVIPKAVRLPCLVQGEALTRKVRVMSASQAHAAFRIRRVECPKGVTVGEYPTDLRNAFDLAFTFRDPVEPEQRGVITIHTQPLGTVTIAVNHDSAREQLSARGGP